jgi:hypothetical protein
MKHIRLITLASLALLALGACDGSGDVDDTLGATSSNDLLSYVAADSPYVAANMVPVPEKVIDTYLERVQPVMDTLQWQLTTALEDLESNPTESDHPHTRLMQTLLMELDGKLSRTGLESLGFDLQLNRVMYGMGAFPVIRLGLSDAQTLRETVMRVLDKAQISAPEQEFQGVSYWRLSDEADDDVTAGVYVSIFDDHLAVSLFPVFAEAELLPAFLGLELPADSNAQARLAILNKTHGYTGYGSGILDVRMLADQLMSPETVAGRTLARSGAFDPASLAPECVSEVHGIIANTPLLTMGVKELDETAIATQYRVETPSTLASQLLGLVSKIPAADPMSDRLLEFAFGMRFGPVRDFLQEKVTAIQNDPFQCAHLQELNDNAAQALEQLNQPMPPFLNNLQGVRVSLSDIVMNFESVPENATGYMAVHVEQPQMLVGMAQMFLPDLSNLAIAPGEPPVQIPENLIPVPGLVTFGAMSKDAIGLSLGAGEETGLTAFLDRKAGSDGTFLSASYDMATYLEYREKLEAQTAVAGNGDDDRYPGDDEGMIKLREAANKAMKQMVDRSEMSLQFTADGLVIDNRMTFKQ